MHVLLNLQIFLRGACHQCYSKTHCHISKSTKIQISRSYLSSVLVLMVKICFWCTLFTTNRVLIACFYCFSFTGFPAVLSTHLINFIVYKFDEPPSVVLVLYSTCAICTSWKAIHNYLSGKRIPFAARIF